jgi:hypothetical protein
MDIMIEPLLKEQYTSLTSFSWPTLKFGLASSSITFNVASLIRILTVSVKQQFGHSTFNYLKWSFGCLAAESRIGIVDGDRLSLVRRHLRGWELQQNIFSLFCSSVSSIPGKNAHSTHELGCR